MFQCEQCESVLLRPTRVRQVVCLSVSQVVCLSVSSVSVSSVSVSYHAPPECVSVVGEPGLALLVHGVFLGEVHEVRGEYQAQEADVQGGYQLLQHRRSDGGVRGGRTSVVEGLATDRKVTGSNPTPTRLPNGCYFDIRLRMSKREVSS